MPIFLDAIERLISPLFSSSMKDAFIINALITAMSFTLFSNQLYLHAITTFTFILLSLITSRIVFILIVIIIIIIIIIIVIIMIIIVTIIIIIINTLFSLSELSSKSYD